MSIQNLSRAELDEAFDRTPEAYRDSSLAQRNPSPMSAGSTFLRAVTWEELRALDWSPHLDPDVVEPMISFRAPLPGTLGIAPLSKMNPNDHVFLRPAHKGQHRIESWPESGQLATECVADLSEGDGRRVEFTTLLLRPSSQPGGGWEVETFYPGPAAFSFPVISIRQVQARFKVDSLNVRCAVSEAIELGFTHCKHALDT